MSEQYESARAASPVRVVVVQAGLSVPSSTKLLADQIGRAVTDRLALQGQQVRLEVIDLRDLAHPLADALVTGFSTGALADALDAVAHADALVAVTPVFSASYSGLFKTFFDVLEPETLAGTPVLMAATAGTARHSLVLDHALRPLFSYLKAIPVPTGIFAATDDFGDDSGLQPRIQRAATELVAMLGTGAPVALRRTRPVEDEFEDPTPFADMLAALDR